MLQLLKQVFSIIPAEDHERQTKAHFFLKSLPMLSTTLDEAHKKLIPSPAEVQAIQKSLRFEKFVFCGRACSICLRNDFCADTTPIDWQCCPTCHFGWCCSPDHWDEYKGQHTPEICTRYQTATKMELFHYQHAKKHNELLLHIPEKVLSSALRTFPKDWNEYFTARFVGQYPDMLPRLPPEFYPASTKLLSQPVTCLAAMYKHGISHYSTKKNLIIHVVGADSYEIPATCVWEEISHCLPQVQALTIQFIGPDACKMITPPTLEYPTEDVEGVCPGCTAKGRRRLTGMYGYTYHDYAQKYLNTSKHSKPDFIVAYNTGMYENDTESWTTSLEVLLDLNVPAYFTSYCKDEAIQDFALLQNLRANILQLGPEENPFTENCVQIEHANENRIDKFFANNNWGVLFQGRKAD